jgi:hypothetical protein
MNNGEPMPTPDQVDPLFDGHPERPWAALTVAEKLDWIWASMQLLHAGRLARRRTAAPQPPPRAGPPNASIPS